MTSPASASTPSRRPALRGRARRRARRRRSSRCDAPRRCRSPPPVTSATRPANRLSFDRCPSLPAASLKLSSDDGASIRPRLPARHAAARARPTPGGHAARRVTLEALRAGRIARATIRATPETLRRQAEVARAAGRRAARREPRARGRARRASRTSCCSRSTPRCGRTARRRRSSRSWAERLEGYGAPRDGGVRARGRGRVRRAGAARAMRSRPLPPRAPSGSSHASCSSRRCPSSASSPWTGRTTPSRSSSSRTGASSRWTGAPRPSSTSSTASSSRTGSTSRSRPRGDGARRPGARAQARRRRRAARRARPASRAA